MSTSTMADAATLRELAEGLSEAEKAVLTSPRFNPNGWEPPNPFNRLIVRLVDLGLFVRRDGRCGFESFKDSFIVPTELCLALRDHLQSEGNS